MNTAAKDRSKKGHHKQQGRKQNRKRPDKEKLNKLIQQCNLTKPSNLPISRSWHDIIDAIKQHQVVIVVGETGSGKTTQIPKLCLLAGRGQKDKIAITQPRRVAAMTMSRRLASELGPAGKELVGYKIRFQDRCPPLSQVWFMTDGLLLAQLPKDPNLSNYDTIIVDEAHERSLNIDFLLGVLRKLLKKRPDLKVIITSATLDIEKFVDAFNKPPVINVEGRGYPVDIIYLDPDTLDVDGGGPADLVVEAVRLIRQKDVRGHILAFLPTEQSIMEGLKVLQGELENDALVLPMFGRLSAKDQSRIFEPSTKQKIILATNVAETSITVPGIKYVVDSGLARISQYNPRTRTKALPVSRISQSSADQRAGRAGRTAPGKCYRLYTEEDYLSRPQFTPPEILRSNLAEVVLRLKYLGLGNVLEFPFIDPPSPQAVKEAETALKLLGAVNEKGKLTRTGLLMARLPLDPRVSKMILEAKQWNCLTEVTVIAAALSIQDPTERPLEKQAQADQAHAKFKDKHSDFITYLNIWNSYQELFKKKASRKERINFCKNNYLSFRRMEEWIDACTQIRNILAETGTFSLNKKSANYEQIHRAILPGLLDQIACKKKGTLYIGARGRELYLFPGSSIYKTRPAWILTAEIIKTSQLFARTAAMIEPKWIEKAGNRFLKRSYISPHWEKRRGEVMAYEKITLFGLTIVEKRKVSYSNIEPEIAHEIFINEALIPAELNRPFAFLKHNQKLIKKIEEVQNKLRQRDILIDEKEIASFYKHGINKLVDIALSQKNKQAKQQPLSKKLEEKFRHLSREKDLAYLIKIAQTDEPLRFSKDFLTNRLVHSDEALFPGHIEVDGHELTLHYRFDTEDVKDGITVQIPEELVPVLDPRRFDWLVPGLLEEKIFYLLKGLPKRIRKELIPIAETASKAANALEFGKNNLYQQLQLFLKKEHGLSITPDMWPKPSQIPQHLLFRFEVISKNKIVASSRDFIQLQKQFSKANSQDITNHPEYRQLKKQWEHESITIDFLDKIPESLQLQVNNKGHSINVWVGLIPSPSGNNGAGSKLFFSKAQALEQSRKGLIALLAQHLSKDLKKLLDYAMPVKEPFKLLPLFPGQKALKKNIAFYLIEHLCVKWDHIPNKQEFLDEIKRLKSICFKESSHLLKYINNAISEAIKAKTLLQNLCSKKSNRANSRIAIFNGELKKLISHDFPLGLSIERLKNMERYLKGLSIRINRAYADPTKDIQKDKQFNSFLKQVKKELENAGVTPDKMPQEIELALEEYKISIFAPEIKTLFPVSEKRILKMIQDNL